MSTLESPKPLDLPVYMPTKSQQTQEDVVALFKSRHTLLWIVTREELRVERLLMDAGEAAVFETRFWDCAAGLTDMAGKPIGPGADARDPLRMLDLVGKDTGERIVYVMRDLHRWFDNQVVRQLRNLAKSLSIAPAKSSRIMVIIAPSGEVPPDLAGHATVIEWPLPEREEIALVLDESIKCLRPEMRAEAEKTLALVREQAIDAAVGLTSDEASNCYAKSLVATKRIDPAQVSAEKKRVIARERVLTWFDPDPRGLDAVGGLGLLKRWLVQRKDGFSERARAYGLPTPKGVFLLGPPGTGKSLTAKAVAAAYGFPLLRLDMGALRSKYVGDSEANLRKALATAETVAPCIIWLDEIEKALAGATGPAGDGGVAADALGTVLSWMQERKGTVFVVATANQVENLPPELLRKGRFDELFFIDLPNAQERVDVLATALRSFGRDYEDLDGSADARQQAAFQAATDGFSGAEIAQGVVPTALFAAYNDGQRELTLADITVAAKATTPLSKTAADKIQALREWAKTRTVPASLPEKSANRRSGRELDM